MFSRSIRFSNRGGGGPPGTVFASQGVTFPVATITAPGWVLRGVFHLSFVVAARDEKGGTGFSSEGGAPAVALLVQVDSVVRLI